MRIPSKTYQHCPPFLILKSLLDEIDLKTEESALKELIQSQYIEEIKLQCEFDKRDILNYYQEKESLEDFERNSRIWFEDLEYLKKTKSYQLSDSVKNEIQTLENLLNTLNGKSDGISKTNSSSKSKFEGSFQIKVPEKYNGEFTEVEIIDILYKVLIKNNVIIGDEKDFRNAFTQKPLKKGIIWNVKSNVKKTSKPTLLYFLKELKEKGFITNYKKYDKIGYVFKDDNGEAFKNLNKVNIESNIQNLEIVEIAIDEFINILDT